ncbi:MAG: starch phosphorylase, partial [Mariniblastus sp.]
GMVNMTYLALNLSEYVNGVAKKHGEVSRLMFAHYKIDSITNGVHGATWASRPMATLFDQHIPGWREDNFSFRYALNLSNQDVWQAHQESKQELLDEILRVTSQELDPGVLTLGFARRATPYKRPGLLFHDLNRLRSIAKDAGKLQVVFAGKAHPHDDEGKDLIRNIVRIADELKAEIPIVYLPNYGMRLGQLITAGVDIWLNTPKPPLEASGTSGMKAAINGVPSLSVLDGWWIEGCIEGVTGWAIGSASLPSTDSGDAESLYHKLEQIVFPMYYHDRPGFIEIMRHAIALNGSFFNTHRMVQQYAQKAYL